MKREVSVLLHNIRSTHNVGSMFRTADTLGVDKVYLSGYAPTPLDSPRKDMAKVALGAEKNIDWEQVSDPLGLIQKLKIKNYKIIALEQTVHSVDYKKVKIKTSDKVLFVVGNEVGGVEQEILKLCDAVAEIPIRGKKESLNVSVAFGVALFRMLNQ